MMGMGLIPSVEGLKNKSFPEEEGILQQTPFGRKKQLFPGSVSSLLAYLVRLWTRRGSGIR